MGVTPVRVLMTDTNAKGQVATISRRLLDPRRPVGKPSSADKEEMLIPYDSFLPQDVKRVISHRYDVSATPYSRRTYQCGNSVHSDDQVLGATHLSASPALIESSSLLLAHGLDLFLTRGLAPSGTFDILSDKFNKVQLLLTLAGLSVGILIAKPAVSRKALKARWY